MRIHKNFAILSICILSTLTVGDVLKPRFVNAQSQEEKASASTPIK